MDKKVGIIVGIIILLVVGAFICMPFVIKDKIAYVNFMQIYDGFKMKKELEAKLTLSQQARKNFIDSLENDIREMHPSTDDKLNAVIGYQKKFIEEKYREFDELNQKQAEDYQKQILLQINTYVKEFGKLNRYQYILGANGEGTLMYAEESKDISAEVLQFINNRYEGGK
jgi:outer membrane protein